MLQKFERYPLTFGPTHIEKLERLGAHLGGKVDLYAKREDCNSGLAFGGNKLRKLEYIIPDAIAQTPTPWSRSAVCNPTIRAWWRLSQQRSA
jgi:1-aminocyclopropane-1-carboxylate deaminase/D-cysteine desulfhydrase-like pyridoxal-dependent ACC family enzyme